MNKRNPLTFSFLSPTLFYEIYYKVPLYFPILSYPDDSSLSTMNFIFKGYSRSLGVYVTNFSLLGICIVFSLFFSPRSSNFIILD